MVSPPSSGAHTTVSTESGTCQTVTSTRRYGGRVGTACISNSSTIVEGISNGLTSVDAVDTVVCAPDDGWRYHPKHVEQFPEINKVCNVTSCWIYIRIYLT